MLSFSSILKTHKSSNKALNYSEIDVKTFKI